MACASGGRVVKLAVFSSASRGLPQRLCQVSGVTRTTLMPSATSTSHLRWATTTLLLAELRLTPSSVSVPAPALGWTSCCSSGLSHGAYRFRTPYSVIAHWPSPSNVTLNSELLSYRGFLGPVPHRQRQQAFSEEPRAKWGFAWYYCDHHVKQKRAR